MKKVEWMCYITYFELCMSILYYISLKGSLSVAGIFGYCFAVVPLFFLIWNGILGIGHLAASIYYCLKGLGPSPVLLYPFVFGANKRKCPHLFWNFFYMGDTFYPEKLFTDTKSYEKSVISTICQTAQWVSFYAQIVFCVLYGFCLLIGGYGLIGLSSVFFIMIVCLMANTKTDTYHGCFIRVKYMKQGYTPLYLARRVILYSKENHDFYHEFENIMLNSFHKDFEYFSLETIKHMYMTKCVNEKFSYPDKIKDIVEDSCFLKSLDEYTYRKMDIADEKFSLMKAYLCYCVLSNDTSGKNILRYYLELLSNEENRSFIKYDTFQWYLQVLEKGKAQEQGTTRFKNTVLRRNQFLEAFDNYKKIYMQITEKMQ